MTRVLLSLGHAGTAWCTIDVRTATGDRELDEETRGHVRKALHDVRYELGAYVYDTIDGDMWIDLDETPGRRDEEVLGRLIYSITRSGHEVLVVKESSDDESA